MFPDKPLLSNPAQFRRRQGFYITSDIKITCAESELFYTEWVIHNCNSTCSFPIQTHRSIGNKTTELFIPSKTLDYGIYQFNLTVRMSAFPNTMVQSAVAYIEITYSNITANLIKYGTSIITSGRMKNLTLDPGQYSTNPDEGRFDPRVSNKLCIFSRTHKTFLLDRIGAMSIHVDHMIYTMQQLLVE